MTNQPIIHYIKLREAWKDTLRAKSSALSSIWNGLFTFGIFLVYWAVEKIFLKKEIEAQYQANPNFKYIFYISLALGLLGIANALWGAYNYFKLVQQAEQLKRQVEEMERSLL